MRSMTTSITSLGQCFFVGLLVLMGDGHTAGVLEACNGGSANLTRECLLKQFSASVTPTLNIPDAISDEYISLLENTLQLANEPITSPQFVILVDRNPNVQVVFLYLGAPKEGWTLIGATPTSTGLPGKYEHFLTPLGVFEHSLSNPDFRAEGTKNELGFRGYGAKGMRVYDFGWVPAQRTWGNKSMGVLRLQMHATDPELAEPLLGTPRSEGCIRIPASLNYFIDHYGVIDSFYEEALTQGVHFWVLAKDRESSPFSGRYLVVVDSGLDVKPLWSRVIRGQRVGQLK